ncbi:MAG TPA: hypothetical protein VLV15_06215 [Dongiaceae bacterium]|nr:hypothetical protein [Dongiaceae bacterium]
MFIGHAAVGFAAKRVAPRASMGVLLTAPYLADLLWPVFLLLGWERVRIDPGNTPVTPLDFVSYPWSHSLLMSLVWSALFGWVYFAATRDRRGAWVAGALVASHWVLDFATHRPDLPLLAMGGPKVGLGLWYSKVATIAIEGAMFVAGLGVYLSTTRARGWLGHLSLWSLVGLLSFAYVGNLTGPPPGDPHTLAVVALVGYVFVPWAIWIERTRAPRHPALAVARTP